MGPSSRCQLGRPILVTSLPDILRPGGHWDSRLGSESESARLSCHRRCERPATSAPSTPTMALAPRWLGLRIARSQSEPALRVSNVASCRAIIADLPCQLLRAYSPQARLDALPTARDSECEAIDPGPGRARAAAGQPTEGTLYQNGQRKQNGNPNPQFALEPFSQLYIRRSAFLMDHIKDLNIGLVSYFSNKYWACFFFL